MNDLIIGKVFIVLKGYWVNFDLVSSLQYEMLLLMDFIFKEDSCWEFWLCCVFSFFFMVVNIKIFVVVENIIFMCLRILQKLIKLFVFISKKNKDVFVEVFIMVKLYCNEIYVQV